MSSDRRSNAPNPFAKEWDPGFSSPKNYQDDKCYVERREGNYSDDDHLDMFLEDAEDSVPSREVEEMRNFCQDVSTHDLISRDGIPGKCRARLDDREYPPQAKKAPVRNSQSLSASELYKLLKEPRFNNGGSPNADRRLIHIPNLDPHFILALAKTASQHQVSVLREAIWKHLALQTAFGVKIPTRGHRMYHLEFHFPYYALRKLPATKACPPNPVHTKPPRQWIDLSFLGVNSPKSEVKQADGIHESHISLVICGTHNSRWVGYAFDTDLDDEEVGEDEDPDPELNEDPAAWNGGKYVIDANIPIWDPREYFLAIAETRMCQILKEWRNLVRALEQSINAYLEEHPSLLAPRSKTAGEKTINAKEVFDWTQRAMKLLQKLFYCLSETVQAWETFKSSDGDIGYFCDVSPPPNSSRGPTYLSIRGMKETFEELKRLERRLLLLEKSCFQSAQILELRLTVESTEIAHHSRVATELTLSIVSPVAIVLAYFGTPEAVFFERNSKSFFITLIILMILVRLLLHQCWWLGRVTSWIKGTQIAQQDLRSSIRRFGSRFGARRRRNGSENLDNGIEITMGV